MLVDPDTAYWITLVLITNAQTAHAFPIPRSGRPLRLTKNSSLFASRRRTCAKAVAGRHGARAPRDALRLRLGGWGRGGSLHRRDAGTSHTSA
jgi:hypothetical protein